MSSHIRKISIGMTLACVGVIASVSAQEPTTGAPVVQTGGTQPTASEVTAINKELEKQRDYLRIAFERIQELQKEVQTLRGAAKSNGSVKIYKAGTENLDKVHFPPRAYGPGHKAPVFIVEVPDAKVGDTIVVNAQCTMNVRSYGDSTFVASQIRVLDQRPDLMDTKLQGVTVSPENGENINAQNPYKVLTKFGAFEVTKTPVVIVYYAWCSSERATEVNHIKIVKGYGSMVVQHYPSAKASPTISAPPPVTTPTTR